MIRTAMLGWILLGTGSLAFAGDDAKKVSPLDRLKALAGEWVKMGDDGKPTSEKVSIYRVTAGGSAVVETLFPGSDHEMVTMYHMDGEDLVLTHYCSQGNQPRMKARRDAGAEKLVFDCVGGTNMKSEEDAHMHHAEVTFLGADRLRSAWDFFDKGKKVETATFDLARSKKG